MAKQLKDADTAKKILDAARKIFLVKGMAGARMQDIADEAGMNKALLHYYFKNKEKLFEKIFLEEAKKFFPRINLVFDSNKPLEEKIALFVNQYIDEFQQNPYLPIFMLTQINQDTDKFLNTILGKTPNPNPHHFLSQVEKEIRKGTIRKINPVHLLLNLLSMCIFPFIARPMILKVIGLDQPQFKQLMEERRQEIPRFIMESIRK